MNARQLSVDGGDAGTDGLFTREELRDSSVSNRVFTAEMLVDEVVAECNAYAAVVRDPNGIWQPACDTLAAWDRRVDVDSVGAALWREFIDTYSGAELIDAGPLWAVGFDPADPLGTPNGLSPDAEVPTRIAAAVLRLRAAGFDLASPLGDLQMADRNGERIAVHGGTGAEGVTNVVGFGDQRHDDRTRRRARRADRGIALADDARLPGEQRHELHLRRRVHHRRPGRRGLAHLRGERGPDEPVLRRPDGDVRRQAVASDPVHGRRDRRRPNAARVHDQRIDRPIQSDGSDRVGNQTIADRTLREYTITE